MNTNEIKNTNTTNTQENAAVAESTAAQSNMTNVTSETLYSEIPPISVEGDGANDGISVMCVGGSDCTCPDCEEDTGGGSENVPVTSVTVSTSTKILSVGGTAYIGAIICPENATNQGVSWYSEDTSIVTAVEDSVGCKLTGKANGQAYVVATSDENSSLSSRCLVTVGTGVDEPDPPVVTVPAAPSITLNGRVIYWSPVANADGYKLYCYNSSGVGGPDTITGSSEGEMCYDISNMRVVDTYDIYVTAYNSAGESGESNHITYTIHEIATPVPVIDTANKLLTWNAIPYATGYTVYYGEYIAAETTETSFDLSGYGTGTHEFRVKAYNDIMYSAKSEPVTYTVGGTTETLSAPVVVNNNGILTWSSVENAVGYYIYNGEEKIGEVSATTVAIPIITTAGTHTIYVTTYNDKTESARSNAITIIVEATDTEAELTMLYDTDLAPSVEGVNLHTGKLTYSFGDISLDGYGIPLAVSHVYAPDTDPVSDRFGLGNGWRTTLNQTLTQVDTDYYYTDAQGKSYKFASNDGGTDGSGAGLTLNGSTVTDRAGNAMIFDTLGRLTELADSYGNKLTVAYNTDGKISTVTDSYGRTATFSYTGGRLSSITAAGCNKTISYAYDNNGNLATVTLADNTSLTFAYGENIFTVTGSTGYVTVYNYTSDKVTSITHSTTVATVSSAGVTTGGNTVIENVDITYTDTYTSVLSRTGNKTFYRFLTNGKVWKVYSTADRDCTEIGASKGVVTTYTYDNNGELATEVTEAVKDAFGGLIANSDFSYNDMYWTTNCDYAVTNEGGRRYITMVPKAGSDLPLYFRQAVSVKDIYIPGDKVYLSATVKPQAALSGASQFFYVRAIINYIDETRSPDIVTLDFDATKTEWQTNTTEISIESNTVDNIEVQLETTEYGHSAVCFENVALTMPTSYRTVTKEGDVVDKTVTPYQTVTKTYDSKYKITSHKTEAVGKSDYIVTYSYDSGDRLDYINDTDGNVTKYTYVGDSENTVKGLVKTVEHYHSVSPSTRLTTTYAYDSTNTPMAYTTVTDENGVTVIENYSEAYNKTTVLPSAVAVGTQVTSYTYDKTTDLVEKMSATVDDATINISYGYKLNALTSVTAEDGTVYKYEYDGRGNLTKVSKVQNNVATTVLLEKEYYYSEDGSYIMQVITTYGAKSDLTAPYVTATYDARGNVTYVECSGETDILANYTYQNDVLTSAEKLDNDCTFVYNYIYGIGGKLDKITRRKKDEAEDAAIDYVTYGYDGNKTAYTSYALSSDVFHGVAPKYSDGAKSELVGVKVYDTALTEENKDTATPLFETTLERDALQRLTKRTIDCGAENDISESYGYGTGTRPTSFTGMDGAENKFTYDACGNIAEIRDANDALIVEYTYDSLNRLTKEDNYVLGKSIETTYDTSGNITRKIEYCLCEDGTTCGTLSDVDYTYGSTGKLLGVSGDEGFTVGGYDAQGNPTVYRGNSLTWSRGHDLASYGGNISFKYNADDLRVQKNVTADGVTSTTNYIYVGTQLVGEARNTTGYPTLQYFYDENGIRGFQYSGRTFYYGKNMLGDITDVYMLDMGSLTKVAHYDYDAWGNHTIVLDTDGIGTLNPFRYRGYYYDTETGLYYLQSRYYDPEVGRFISQDNVSYLDPESFGGTNLYAYCGNNPVMGYDPYGTFDWGIFWRSLGSMLAIAGGIALCFVPGAQAIGAGLIIAGAGGLIGGFVGHATDAGFKDGWDIGTMIGGAIGLTVASPQLLGLTVNTMLPTFAPMITVAGEVVLVASSATVVVPVGGAIAVVAGVGLLGTGISFMGNPTTKNPNDPSKPHNNMKNGKSNWDRHSGRRSGGIEKKDSRMKYRKWKRGAKGILYLSLLEELNNLFDYE